VTSGNVTLSFDFRNLVPSGTPTDPGYIEP
jgi:hypothetical protein